MTDVGYLCQNCGSVHEVESVRENLILDLHTGVRASFVGDQDRFAGSAGHAAGVWLRAGYQTRSSGRLACWQRSVVMASAPATVQRMPDCLRRRPITDLQLASTTPEPTNRPRDRNQW